MIHVTETIKYVGVNDHQVDLFRGPVCGASTACPTTRM